MLLKTALTAWLQCLPKRQPSSTPVLSPCRIRSVGWSSIASVARMSSSNPTALAHPMSFFPRYVFQSAWSLQALHLDPMTMPIPKPELASEKA